MSEPLRRLSKNERKALSSFVSRLRALYGEDLLRVVLFGSKARGDFDLESDLDVLVVVRVPLNAYWEHWQRIADLAWEVEFEHDVVLSPLIKDQAAYKQMREWNLLINRNIEQEGVELWTSVQASGRPIEFDQLQIVSSFCL